MTHPSGTLSNEQYINGLRSADPAVLASIYVEFRAAVVRAITSLGGSEADGGIFFRAGLVEAAQQVRAGEFPDGEPFFFQIRELAVAHYRDWLEERLPTDLPAEARSAKAGAMPNDKSSSLENMAGAMPNDESPSPEVEAELLAEAESTAGDPPSPEATAGEPETDQTSNFKLQTPNSDVLRQTRRSIYAWRHFERLDAEQRRAVLASIETTEDSPALEHYRAVLNLPHSADPELPNWLLHALRDTEGYHFWQKTQDLERKIANRESLVPPAADPANKWIPRILLALAALLLASWGYNYFFRAATPREVYKENFQPPASILDDLQSRQSADTMSVGPLPERPRACEEMLQQADANYQEKDYSSAAQVLYNIADDPSLAACHSDAWFYLGIIGLHLDDPGTTLQSFAKIDNLDRFGEDIYWYQALAFVKLAEQQPQLRDKAERAVERALGATQSAERRERAEEMLKQLSGGKGE